MSYSLATLWYERQRFMPGVLAVAFSALLIAMQCGLLLGLFSITSIPIDKSHADIWVGHPEIPSIDLGRPIPESWGSYVWNEPGVERYEVFMEGFTNWVKPTGGNELALVIGSRLSEPDPLGAIDLLTPEHRILLSEPGAIVVDSGEFGRLGITKIGDTAEVNGRKVHVVGTVKNLRSLAAPYLFCSVDTARSLLFGMQDQTTFILARCYNKEDAPSIVAELKRKYPRKISAFTADEFSLHSRMHWLTKTRAGIALGLAAALGLLVGAVVTSQTLYAATAASMKEYAVLRALGIPRWRMVMTVMAQSFWIGVAGVALALPTIIILASFGEDIGAKILLPWWLLTGAVCVTMFMALMSGLLALRSLRMIEPVTLLR
jgi:putative ABC transport system permease protein